MYWVYVLECSDKSLYTGITTDLARRLAQHQKGEGGHYTRAKRGVRFVYTEAHPDRSAASKREAQIKRWRRARKLGLVQSGAPASARRSDMKNHRIYGMSFGSVYPLYVAKAQKKGRTKAEVDEAIKWLTGYTQRSLESQIKKGTDFETFLAAAPRLNPKRSLITGVVCGVRVEDIKEPTMQGIRYLDKLVDELAKGRPMEKVLRKG